MQIETAFRPGDLGGIASFHGTHYSATQGMGLVFEARVAAGLAEFAERKSEADLVQVARDDAGLAGALVLDLGDPASADRGAHLRWFFLKHRARGLGLGREMMRRAMTHTDRHCDGRAWLTTIAGLDAARRLYEANGFVLWLEESGTAWGKTLLEQEFRRKYPGSPA